MFGVWFYLNFNQINDDSSHFHRHKQDKKTKETEADKRQDTRTTKKLFSMEAELNK